LEHGKIPPCAVDLEEAVLGALLTESDAFDDVASILTPESFYRLEHQHIFSAMCHLAENSQPIDILTVTARLKQVGQLDMVGGPYFVSQLTDSVAGSANAEFHARIIQQKFIARELIRVSGDIYHTAYEDTTDVMDLLDKANDEFSAIGSDTIGEKVASNQDICMEIIGDAERAAEGGNIIGIPIGIREVDRITGGLQDSHLDILAARPGMGKSSWAIYEAYVVAFVAGKPALFFSLEMTAKEVMLKLLSILTGIDTNKIKRGNLDPEQWNRIHEAIAKITASKLTIIDNIFEWSKLRTFAINQNKKGKLGLLTVDYLQLIQIANRKGNREQEIGEISRGLKQLAKHLNCPVRALAQLSRAVETRGGTKRPMLSDLRESGQIEQDADSVTFLYRPEYYGIEFSEEGNLPTAGLCEFIVAKNRGGLTGTAPTRADLATSIFSEFGGSSFTAPRPPSLDEPIRSPMPRSEMFDILDDKEEDVF
jgi:replicative DNA helicase